MMKKLLLLAVAGMLVTSCSRTYMADVAPETRDCQIGEIEIGGFNASSVVTYCKNPYTGCIETSGIQVHRDSGINNAAKIAASAAYVAGGTGQVLSGVGALKYGDAWENISQNGLKQTFKGLPGTNINIEGSSAHAGGGTSEANAGASAAAKAIQKNHNDIDIGISNSNKNGGGHKGGGHGKPGMPNIPH